MFSELLEFARAGNLTLGGGQPIIAELQRRLMIEKRWLPEEDFGLLYGIARLTPGTSVLAFIAGAGARLGGPSLGILAVVAASLPASLVIWLMSIFFDAWSQNRWVAASLSGAMAAVVALIVASAWQIFQPLRKLPLSYFLAVAAFIAGLTDLAGPVTILLTGAFVGAFWFRE